MDTAYHQFPELRKRQCDTEHSDDPNIDFTAKQYFGNLEEEIIEEEEELDDNEDGEDIKYSNENTNDSHSTFSDSKLYPIEKHETEKNILTRFWEDREVEIVVLVEGTDELTSCPVQARHSYRYDEIIWDHTFDTCVFRDSSRGCMIDFNKFHSLKPTMHDSLFTGSIASHI